MSVTVAATISNQISVSATIGATLTINTGSDVNIISCTLPASGSTITDVDGNTVGTWTATDEISFTVLASISLKNIIVEVSGNILRYINSSDTVNDIDDAASRWNYQTTIRQKPIPKRQRSENNLYRMKKLSILFLFIPFVAMGRYGQLTYNISS